MRQKGIGVYSDARRSNNDKTGITGWWPSLLWPADSRRHYHAIDDARSIWVQRRHFFSYFTNLSNIFAAIVLIVGAVYLIQHREPTANEEIIRGASVVAMAIVGIVFSLLLRNEDLGTLAPWVNFVLHYLMPVVVVLDWLYQPPKMNLRLPQIGYWLIYPLIYLVYSLIRGAAVGFYAYPFLNPAKVGGYGGVALYCIAIFAMFLIFGWIFLQLGNRLQRNVQ